MPHTTLQGEGAAAQLPTDPLPIVLCAGEWGPEGLLRLRGVLSKARQRAEVAVFRQAADFAPFFWSWHAILLGAVRQWRAQDAHTGRAALLIHMRIL